MPILTQEIKDIAQHLISTGCDQSQHYKLYALEEFGWSGQTKQEELLPFLAPIIGATVGEDYQYINPSGVVSVDDAQTNEEQHGEHSPDQNPAGDNPGGIEGNQNNEASGASGENAGGEAGGEG